MAQISRDVLWSSLFGQYVPVPQHEKLDGTMVPTGANNPLPVQLSGSYVKLSTEPKPTAAQGAKDGNDLLEVDTGKVFVFYAGTWREI